MTAEQALKAIMNAEDMSKMWRKIQFTDKGCKENNITSSQVSASWPETSVDISPQLELEGPKNATEWKLVDLPQEVLHYLTLCNCCHFRQAHGTPFTVPPLSQCFDWSANSSVSEFVLQGKYSNVELDDIT
eukprot:11803093-Ditylum_brightwellii.AAC.1